MNYKKFHPHYCELEISDYTQGRLRLVEPKVRYAEIGLGWVKNHEVTQYMGGDFSNPSFKKEKERLREIIKSVDEYSWMIEMDGKIIGNTEFRDIKRESKKFGVRAASYTLIIGDQNYWRRGIGKSVTKAVLDWAFDQGRFEVIFARALEQNTGSLKNLIGCGFENTGTTPYETPVNGQLCQWQNFKMTKERYLKK